MRLRLGRREMSIDVGMQLEDSVADRFCRRALVEQREQRLIELGRQFRSLAGLADRCGKRLHDGCSPLISHEQNVRLGQFHVIVLGGVINSEVSAARGQITLGEAAERMVAAVELARQYPSARIVFAGGNAMLISDGYAEADFAQLMFEKLGVPRDRLSFERESRNTEENAVFSKRLVAPKPGERWLLVTSAMHMPRAIGTFRQVGFPVEAYPVDYQTRGRGNVWAIPDSLMGGLAATDLAFHEWLGLFVYWITGRIPVLFPAP